MLFVSPNSALPTILHRYANKTMMYDTGSFGKTENIFSTQNWERHARMRKLLAGPVSGLVPPKDLPFTNVKKMEPLIDVRIQHWVETVSAEFSGKGETFDFAYWAKILDARTEDGKPLDTEFIKAEVLILIAGADTSGTAFQSLVHFVLANKSVYDKLMAEVDGANIAGNLSATPKFDELLKHCPYYIASTKEALRLRCLAPNLLSRLVPSEGSVVEGMHIPGGTELTCNPWVAGRDEALYGSDALVFQPERWLENGDQTALYEKYSLAFDYGTRSCLGKDIALMELYKAPL
ncbi:MAG: hypothetical protein Q9214_002115 [Letrouitia sp. 1 TL-2023]